MEKEFVPYQEALALKEIGFDESCFGYYIELRNPKEGILTIGKCEKNSHGIIIAPTYSQAFRWFREEHDLKIYFAYWNGFNIEITEAEDMGAYQYECYVIPPNGMSIAVRGEEGNVYFKNYEEAELACLRALIRRARESTIGENTGPRG